MLLKRQQDLSAVVGLVKDEVGHEGQGTLLADQCIQFQRSNQARLDSAVGTYENLILERADGVTIIAECQQKCQTAAAC